MLDCICVAELSRELDQVTPETLTMTVSQPERVPGSSLDTETVRAEDELKDGLIGCH